MFQRHQFEIDCLNPWPHHPVLLERLDICTLQLIFWTRSFHDSHAAKEKKEVGRCKDALISQDASGNSGIGVLEVDLLLEKFEPCCCAGAKDSYGRVMLALQSY